MMMFGLALLGGIIAVSVFVNYSHKESNREYQYYLYKLNKVVERKRERNGN